MSIRILPNELINRIAAGEVIERPASVVKELIENSIDAKADDITILVEDGGRTSIKVIDNGVGMSKEDLLKSIQRHATSKLPTNDLLNINFMGFRGEAIPSIASVSDVTINTYNKNSTCGWILDCNSLSLKPSSINIGTVISVNNLFSKIPARLKFLKSDRSEMLAIVDVVKKLAMSKPNIKINLNNKWIYNKNQSLKDRLSDILGEENIKNMLYLETKSQTSNIYLKGFVSLPTFYKSSSIDEYLFVNDRPVKDKLLIGALRGAYYDVIHTREYPVCALYLYVDSQEVDVNVSPAKTEVHFLEPNHIRNFIIKSIREKLAETLISKYTVQSYDTLQTTHTENLDLPIETIFFQKENNKVSNVDNIINDVLDNNRPLGQVIGQFNKKYILSQNGDNLIIVDQHAAHERLTYERLKKGKVKIQNLLTPIIVNLNKDDVLAILEAKQDINDSFIEIEQFGEDEIAIFSKPADWDLNWKKLFEEMASEIKTNGYSSIIKEKLHLKLANYACHYSVRAGLKLDLNQMDALLREIETTERAGQCNHGRPVYKIINISKIDSMFERV